MKPKKQRRNENSFFTRYRKPIIGTLIGIAIIGAGLIGWQKFYTQRTIVTVGDYKITQKDKLYRDQVHKIFYPNDPKTYGSEELVRAYTYAQILKNNGAEITEATLRAEDMRINQNTKSPETLAKIRAAFNGDEEAYQRAFILPTYAERTIYYDFFAKSPKAQAKSLSKVQEFLAQTRDAKADFSELAKAQNLKTQTFFLSRKGGLEWQTEKIAAAPEEKVKAGKLPPGAPAAAPTVSMSREEQVARDQMAREGQDKNMETAVFWIENIIPRLKAGDVLQEPVDFGESWLVIKFEKPVAKEKFQMRAAFIPKDNYQEWLEAEKAKVSISK